MALRDQLPPCHRHETLHGLVFGSLTPSVNALPASRAPKQDSHMATAEKVMSGPLLLIRRLVKMPATTFALTCSPSLLPFAHTYVFGFLFLISCNSYLLLLKHSLPSFHVTRSFTPSAFHSTLKNQDSGPFSHFTSGWHNLGFKHVGRWPNAKAQRSRHTRKLRMGATLLHPVYCDAGRCYGTYGPSLLRSRAEKCPIPVG